jgi:hypothetical protein
MCDNTDMAAAPKHAFLGTSNLLAHIPRSANLLQEVQFAFLLRPRSGCGTQRTEAYVDLLPTAGDGRGGMARLPYSRRQTTC